MINDEMRGSQGDVDEEYVTGLRDADVLLGRGTGPNNHLGNVEFRVAVDDLKRAYVATPSRKAKKRLVQQAVRTVQQVKNGRFLSKLSKSEMKRLKLSQPQRYERLMEHAASSGTLPSGNGLVAIYQIVPDEVAMEKTKQALRYICYKKEPRSGGGADAQSEEEEEGQDEDDVKSVESSDMELKLKSKKRTIMEKPSVKAKAKDVKTTSTTKKTGKRKSSSNLSDEKLSQASTKGPDSTEGDDLIQSPARTLNGNRSAISSFLASSPQKRQRRSLLENAPAEDSTAAALAGLPPSLLSDIRRGVTGASLLAADAELNMLGVHPPPAATLRSSLTAAALAGQSLSATRILENTEHLIASALANTAPAAGLLLPSASVRAPATALSSILSASHPFSHSASAAAALDRELLIAAALRQQQEQERILALQQHYLG